MDEKTILIVDDYRDNRKMIIQLLSKSGVECTFLEAIHSEEALEIIAEEGLPNLILSDLMMPGLNGCELFLECQKKGLKIDKFIVVTASFDNFKVMSKELNLSELKAVESSKIFTDLVPVVKELI